MQYRLSTLFLIFFVVAASLALFGTWGIWIAFVLLIAAICLNRLNNLIIGVLCTLLLFLTGIICPGLVTAISNIKPSAKRMMCQSNLKQLGLVLLNYEDARQKYPSVYIRDKDGKPLFSWMVQLLPFMENSSLYKQLRKDEPWDSPINKPLLQEMYWVYQCPSSHNQDNDSTNYEAIIGPGTIWREKETLKLSDLPEGGSHTVALVEMADSDVHWAQPFALTVEEVLENMKTGKGPRISCYHPNCVNVLFADASIRTFPSRMPLSLWRKILAGGMSSGDLDNIQSLIDPNAPDIVDVSLAPTGLHPGTVGLVSALLVWLFAVILLFRRAIKSRKSVETVKMVNLSKLSE
jgi:hypothetical protein